jgi:signal transduction histidine kinase
MCQAPAEGSLRYPAPIHERRLRLGYFAQGRAVGLSFRPVKAATGEPLLSGNGQGRLMSNASRSRRCAPCSFLGERALFELIRCSGPIIVRTDNIAHFWTTLDDMRIAKAGSVTCKVALRPTSAVSTHGSLLPLEYRLGRADGEYRWVLDNGVPRYTPEGEFAGYIGSCIDITERRRAELEAARQRDELAHLSRVTLLGELSGSLAHELNQPLGAIVTNAGAALRFLARDTMSREKFREILEDIVRRAGGRAK